MAIIMWLFFILLSINLIKKCKADPIEAKFLILIGNFYVNKKLINSSVVQFLYNFVED